MSQARPRPSPRLPWDVLLLVLKECDPSTLARLGRLSLDLLVATSPLLYREIEITSERELSRLFISRKKEDEDSTPSRINPHLSLSQTKILHLDFHTPLPDPHLFFTRILGSDPLPLDLLTISFSYPQSSRESTPNNSFRSLSFTLLTHLDPTRFVFQNRCPQPSPWNIAGETLLPKWNRIRTLEFKGSLLYTGRPLRLAGLASPSLHMVVKLHVSTFTHETEGRALLLLRRLFQNIEVVGMELMQRKSIVLVVRTEEEKTDADEAISALEQRWRSLFVVELEE